ncbi:hypothetical protein OB905_11555 [Halobacteria archaeon AArc-dxtr1]|nr:hypothetical protein [Halobacteria archaeon AArc-dxtr1]
MTLRSSILGTRPARTRVLALAALIPTLASVAFLLEYDAVLSLTLLVAVAVVVTLYAGWARAGVIAGLSPVFLAILWRFVVPPLIGYIRWSEETRYTPPRLLGYKRDPPGELVEGITNGVPSALIGALVIGGVAYLLGSRVRRRL